jgi:hypothetical protein
MFLFEEGERKHGGRGGGGVTSICQRKGAGHLGCPRAEPAWWVAAFRSRHVCSVGKRKKDRGKERCWSGGLKIEWAKMLRTAGVVRADP